MNKAIELEDIVRDMKSLPKKKMEHITSIIYSEIKKEKALIEYVNERTEEAERDRKKGKHFTSLEELQKEYE